MGGGLGVGIPKNIDEKGRAVLQRTYFFPFLLSLLPSSPLLPFFFPTGHTKSKKGKGEVGGERSKITKGKPNSTVSKRRERERERQGPFKSLFFLSFPSFFFFLPLFNLFSFLSQQPLLLPANAESQQFIWCIQCFLLIFPHCIRQATPPAINFGVAKAKKESKEIGPSCWNMKRKSKRMKIFLPIFCSQNR